MPQSAVQLCSSTLIKIGANPVTSFEDGTAEARVAATLYPMVRDALLCAHPWSFAIDQATLPRLATEPIADYEHAFELPVNFLRAVSAGGGEGGRGRGLRYRIVGRQLRADADAVVLTYVFRASEGDFPPYVDQALVARLAAEFCIPLTENSSRAETLYRLAEAELRLARVIDGQQHTAEAIEDFTLTGARLG